MVKKELLIFGGIFIILAGIALFSSNFNGKTDAELLNPDEFSELIFSEDVFIINTHTPYYGEIEGTDMIAEKWDDMEYYRSKLPADKNTPLAVYCRSGTMSSTAVKQLAEMGYKKIYELDGGMNSWQQSGRNIITK